MTQYKKEKAKTLYNNFYENYNMSKQEARECALFVVDELSNEFTRHTDDYNFYNELRIEIDRYHNQLFCEHNLITVYTPDLKVIAYRLCEKCDYKNKDI